MELSRPAFIATIRGEAKRQCRGQARKRSGRKRLRRLTHCVLVIVGKKRRWIQADFHLYKRKRKVILHACRSLSRLLGLIVRYEVGWKDEGRHTGSLEHIR